MEGVTVNKDDSARRICIDLAEVCIICLKSDSNWAWGLLLHPTVIHDCYSLVISTPNLGRTYSSTLKSQ